MDDVRMHTKWGVRKQQWKNHSVFTLSRSYINLVPGYHLTVTANLK